VATGYDPLLDHEPALARTMAASVQQRLAFGERAGQIATITQGEVILKILCHLKLAADPPPIAPPRARQATFDWVA
jgi:hypothetical protein